MKRIVAITALAFTAVLALASCTVSSDDPAAPNQVEGLYQTEYVEVDGNVIKCLWYSKGNRTGSLDCDWDYDSSEYTGTPNKVEGLYQTEYIEVDGKVIKCLWYSKSNRTGAFDCDWS